MLWGDSDQEHAGANLRQLLSRVARVQRAAGIHLFMVSANSVALDASAARIDVLDWLEPGVLRAIDGGGAELEALVGSFIGDLLEEIELHDSAFDEWLTKARAQLRASFTLAATALLDDDRRQSDRDLQLATSLVRLDPTLEPAHRARIRIHGSRGDLAQCRRAYLDCARTLRSELGVEPAPETTELARQFFEVATAPRLPSLAALRQEPPIAAAAEGPRIALLPPLDPSGDETRRRLSTSLLEELTVGLARYRSFRIIAAHTSLGFATGRDIAPADRSWCDYLVVSAIRPVAGGFALTFRLTEPGSHDVLWASELPLHGDLSALFDRVAERVVSVLAAAVERAQLKLPVAAKDSTAYRLFLEGRRCARSTELPQLRRARQWFAEAVRREGTYAPSLAGLARTRSMEWLVRGAPDESLLLEAVRLADRAIAADEHDARGYREKGFAGLYLRNHDESLASFHAAVLRNPNDADLLVDHADALAHSGNPAPALKEFLCAMELNPSPPPFYYWIGGSINYQLGRYRDALELLQPVKGLPATARIYAACAAQVGDVSAARRHARIVRETFPGFRPDQVWRVVPNRNTADTEHLIEGLVRAGLG